MRRQSRKNLAIDLAFLIGIWVLTAVKDFDGFMLCLAVAYTAKVIVFEWWHPWPDDLFEPTSKRSD